MPLQTPINPFTPLSSLTVSLSLSKIMDFLPLKALGFIQLSVLLLSCFNVLANETVSIAQPPKLPPAEAPQHHKGGHHHHHHPKHPPTPPPAQPPTTKPPVHPPTHVPAHPPAKPPVHPPIHAPTLPPKHAPTPLPPRKFVAVQGVVYCKACKYAGIDTLLGATPLLGAVVRLQCNNTKYPLVNETKTDKNGYFIIKAPKTITTYGSHKCKVFVVSSPLATCNKPTNLHYGVKGAILLPATKPPVSSKRPPLPYDLFNVGPFAFEPSTKLPCPR